MSDQQFVIYMIVNGLVAIGTIGAVIVALFQAFGVKLWPPKLVFSLVSELGELTYYGDSTPSRPRPVRYYHLRVRNRRRWSPARDLSVRLIAIEVPRVLGNTLQAAWFGDIPIRCRHQEIYPLSRTIGSAVDYDLCSLSNDSGLSTLSLMPILQPMNMPKNWISTINMVASFQARASECDSKIARVEMAWDGQWEVGDLEMQKHFMVRLLEP